MKGIAISSSTEVITLHIPLPTDIGIDIDRSIFILWRALPHRHRQKPLHCIFPLHTDISIDIDRAIFILWRALPHRHRQNPLHRIFPLHTDISIDIDRVIFIRWRHCHIVMDRSHSIAYPTAHWHRHRHRQVYLHSVKAIATSPSTEAITLHIPTQRWHKHRHRQGYLHSMKGIATST